MKAVADGYALNFLIPNSLPCRPPAAPIAPGSTTSPAARTSASASARKPRSAPSGSRHHPDDGRQGRRRRQALRLDHSQGHRRRARPARDRRRRHKIDLERAAQVAGHLQGRDPGPRRDDARSDRGGRAQGLPISGPPGGPIGRAGASSPGDPADDPARRSRRVLRRRRAARPARAARQARRRRRRQARPAGRRLGRQLRGSAVRHPLGDAPADGRRSVPRGACSCRSTGASTRPSAAR